MAEDFEEYMKRTGGKVSRKKKSVFKDKKRKSNSEGEFSKRFGKKKGSDKRGKRFDSNKSKASNPLKGFVVRRDMFERSQSDNKVKGFKGQRIRKESQGKRPDHRGIVTKKNYGNKREWQSRQDRGYKHSGENPRIVDEKIDETKTYTDINEKRSKKKKQNKKLRMKENRAMKRRRDATPFITECSDCGESCEIPFTPKREGPLYCDKCHRERVKSRKPRFKRS